MAFQGLFIEFFRIERVRRRGRTGGIVELVARIEQSLRDRPVDQAGVEMAQPVMRGELLGEGALAGGGGAVDGDDHAAGITTAEGRYGRAATASLP